MSYPKISIITVVFNGVNQLKETIESVIHQSNQDFEYLIVDGGSTDGSIELIKTYEHQIKNWISEKDSGIYDAMNKGVQYASGDWVCFLNCGDVFVNHSILESVSTELSLCQSPDVLYGDIVVYSSDKTPTTRIAKEPCNAHKMYFCHQSAFVKTTILRQYPFDLSYPMSADFKFFKTCYQLKSRMVHLHQALVVYDRNGISNTRRIDGLKENIRVVKEMDSGLEKIIFLARLYFVIYWRIINKKK